MITNVLSPEKQELLALAFRKRGTKAKRQESVPVRRTDVGPCELSFAQQRLWFLEQLDPHTPTYNIPSALRIEGELDQKALEASLNEIIRRHEALRTTFQEIDQKPVQVIALQLTLSIQIVDLSTLAVEEREPETARLAHEEAYRPFDLTRGPLLRMKLLKLSEREHVFLFTMHHIVSDAWSMGVLVQELAALYPAFRAGKPSPLPALRLQYADFARWQREWLSGERFEQQLQYWRKQLKGAPLSIPLGDRAPSGSKTSRGADVLFALPRELSPGLSNLSSETGASLFMILLASFKALLHRYTAQADVVVGTPIANRQREELEPLIGFFVNMLPVRTDLSGDPTFHQLVSRVKDAALGALSHQDMPFEQLVRELGPESASRRAPLFNVMFLLQNTQHISVQLEGTKVTPIEVDNSTAKFDLTLVIENEDGVLTGSFEYSTDLFEEATVQRMVEHYRELLEGAVKNPELRVSELPLLTAGEYREWVEEWNDTPKLEPSSESMASLIEQQMDRTPQHVAVRDDEQQLTYAELDARANQLAHYLIALGIGPEACVGVCLRRSVSMVVAVLGVLKAGAAYLPLDPTYPADRLAFMLEDGQASVLLTERELLPGLPAHNARTVLLDDDAPAIAACMAERPRVPVRGEQLAYLIYTSGSTGRPKGVMIEQRNCVTFLRWVHTVFTPEELACVVASTSLCFDLSVFELFAPLSVGGSVRVVRNALELQAEEPVTLLNTVPSILAEWLRFQSLPAHLRTLNLAGEPLPLSLARTVEQQAPQLRLLNLYGPSEDTTYSTWYQVPPQLEAGPWIGRPISNTQAYVLDEAWQPVPVGVVGEIYLAGDGLARGYLRRPELTAERFLPNPFAREPGARMYRTGDRGRLRADGNLDCLGRADAQVKLRGCRIELGEIEAVLSQQPGVRNAAVVVREDAGTDPRLVAYVEPGAAQPPSAEELRQQLKQRLPDFMIPSTFVFLDALPQTLNGKVDRKALPAPEDPARLSVEPCTPRDAIEATMLDIWKRLLGHDGVGIRDDFFEVGGHSLLALRLQAEVRNHFGASFPLSAFFDEATLEHLADIVRRNLSASPNKEASPGSLLGFPEARSTTGNVVPIRSDGSFTPLFCVHPIGGSVFCYAQLARELGVNQPVYGLQTTSQSSSSRSIESMAEAYIRSMKTVQTGGRYLLSGWSMGGVIAYEMARQLQGQGDEVASLILIDSFLFPPQWRITADTTLLSSFVQDIAASADGTQPGMPEFNGAFDDCLRRALTSLIECALLPQHTSLAEFRGRWQMYRYNYDALTTYMPSPYSGSITLLAADVHQEHSPIEVWKPLARSGLDFEVLPGDHYGLLTRPTVYITAAKIRERLNAATSHDSRNGQQPIPCLSNPPKLGSAGKKQVINI
jgi:amino acid adenylation domain-containing protein